MLLLALALTSLRWPLIKDSPLMTYAASLFRDGVRPYRDLFEMNWPGTYLVAMAGQYVTGESALGFRVWDLLLLAGFGLAVWRLTEPFQRLTRIVAVLLPSSLYLAIGPYFSAQRDWLLAICVVAAIAILFESTDGRWRPALAGALLGLAVTIKPQAALVVIGVELLLIARSVDRVPALLRDSWPRARAWRDLVWSTLGVVAIIGAEIAWLAWAGSLPAFLSINRDYVGPLYSRLDGDGFEYDGLLDMVGSVPTNLVHSLQLHPRAQVTVVAVMLLSIASGWIWFGREPRRDARTARVGAVGLLAVYGLIHFVVGFRAWPYYWLPFVCAGSVLAALVVEVPWTDPTTGRRRWSVAAASVAVIVVGLAATSLALVSPPDRSAGVTADVDRIDRMTEALETRTPPGATVQTLDTSTGANLAVLESGRRPATRFMYDFHFFHHLGSEETTALRQEFLDELVEDPPGYFLVAGTSWARRTDFDSLELFPALDEQLRTQYRIVDDDPDFRLYERTAR